MHTPDPDKVAREVHEAIQKGRSTFAAILRYTKRRPDPVGDALAYLLIEKRCIYTAQRNGKRVYLPIAKPDKRNTRRPRTRTTQGSRSDAALSFSAIHELMPLRATLRVDEVRK